MKKIYIIHICLIFFALNLTSHAEDKLTYNLRETPLRFNLPNQSGLEFDTSISSSVPSIYFMNTSISDGTGFAYPQFAIFLEKRNSNQTIEEIKKEQISVKGNERNLKIKEVPVNGINTIEVSSQGYVTMDFADGTGGNYLVASYHVIFLHDQAKYRCSMVTEVENFERDLIMAKELCQSVHFQ